MRTERDLTQKALAQKLRLSGFDFTGLIFIRIENGTRFVPGYEVKALSEALGVSCTDPPDV